MVSKYNQLVNEIKHLNKSQVRYLSGFLSSQIYVWLRQIRDRKPRALKIYVEEVDAALDNIIAYPHMGGKKGSMMLAYHHIEYIGQRYYDLTKKLLKEILIAEIKRRQLLKEKTSWDKAKAQKYGDIWCADFTELHVFGMIIYIAVVLDAFSHYYLGYQISDTADFNLVDGAFNMALEKCDGALPERFMINDRGGQYKCELYRAHLKAHGINQVFIPKGTPWNNGEAEVGMRDIKALFYQRLSKTPKGRARSIVVYSTRIADEIFKELNERIPRPKLKGVTPLDVVDQNADEKQTFIKTFIKECKAKRETKKRVENLNTHIQNNIHIDGWNNCTLKNLVNLINLNYKLIVPEKSVG